MLQKRALVLSLFFLFIFYFPVSAQQSKDDSLRLMRDRMAQWAALRYPTQRLAIVEVESAGNVDYTSKLYGKDFLKGRIRGKSAVRAVFNVPVYTSGTQELSVLGVYNSQEMVLRNTVNQISQPRVNDGTYTLQTLSPGINYKRTDTLFHKPVLWGGTLMTHFSLQSSYVRATGLIYGVISLKTTRTTRIYAGLAISIDPSNIIPVIPTFSYWHKFGGSPWEVNIDLPTRALLRRPVFSKGLLSLGTELIQRTLIRKIDESPFQGGVAFRDLSLRNGLTLEYPVLRKVLIGCSAGLLYTPQYRIQDPGKRNSDYIVGVKRDPGPYMNISISLLR
ncbi:MAG: hypothetical protein J0H74_28535 [Chitinophagaceae bacterium]|nr:hypothetical protein [Chitinophagaceae bacterium]